MKKASIKDVAKLAGVSIATVSQIINNKKERFSDETIHKVITARNELGYIPNIAAKRLKGGTSPLIGVLIPSFRMPFFADLIQSMQVDGPENVDLVFMGANEENLETSIYSLIERGADALIFGRPIPEHQQVIEFLNKRNVPYLSLDQSADLDAKDQVMVREWQGGKMAARHLLELGHKKIALLMADDMTDNMHQREAGFIAALLEGGLHPVDNIKTNLSKHGGMMAAEKVIETGATAIFALNDEIAVGLIRGLYNHGVSVPNDISVVGYDDTDYAEFFVPALTTIRQPVQQIGIDALNMIINRLADHDLPQQNETLDLQLIVRESSIPPRVMD
ncbi:LacI family transcriptional regulator [Weissella coleopterorum]|uniref:LacI family transcriptional regulator n=1 Tax=Weissella coleopterorum TaxID=2714949 RepID=A0A6G8AXX3_9LACO|nr:LacI family DNA-binding transcriptional regulator [Weissella coleopterorum]QIL49904.1 LacI family transcriptional regulator [Weissella coleopterorum]